MTDETHFPKMPSPQGRWMRAGRCTSSRLGRRRNMCLEDLRRLEGLKNSPSPLLKNKPGEYSTPTMTIDTPGSNSCGGKLHYPKHPYWQWQLGRRTVYARFASLRSDELEAKQAAGSKLPVSGGQGFSCQNIWLAGYNRKFSLPSHYKYTFKKKKKKHWCQIERAALE